MLKKNQNMVFGLHPSIQTFGRISYGSVQSTKGPRLELFFDVWKVSKRANHKAIQIGSWEEHGGILMYTLNYIHYIEHYRTHMGTVWVQFGHSELLYLDLALNSGSDNRQNKYLYLTLMGSKVKLLDQADMLMPKAQTWNDQPKNKCGRHVPVLPDWKRSGRASPHCGHH